MRKQYQWLLALGLFLIAFTAFMHDEIPSREKAKISGCPLLPANNIWNTPIDTLPLATNSAQYINTIGAGTGLHADFGSGLWNGGPIGIPYTTVPGTQEKVAITFDYDDESDPGPYPIPPDAPIEGGSLSDGDRHVLVLDKDNCILYEIYDAHPQGDGTWHAGSGAVYNLKSNALRPAGWTSADAAGLPILPGLVRYDEVASGEIDHALRFTVPQTQRKYVWPARHFASSLTGTQYPPMGQRFRLKATVDISGYSPQVRVILTALKKYGMILADNGSSWYISGVPDERWNNDVLHQLGNIKGSDLEAVDVSSLMINSNSGEAQQGGTTATITVTSPKGGENWKTGSTHTITWTSTGSVGNVKIQLLKGGSPVLTISSSTANDGARAWTVPGSLAVGSNYQIRITDTVNGSVTDTGGSFSITTAAQPEIALSRTRINAGAVVSGVYTGSQTFRISNSGTGTLNWTISDNAGWLTVSPASGTESNRVTVSLQPAGLSAGSYTGTITISSASAVNSPQTVTVSLTVKSASQDQPPFGSFDTPVQGATVKSSIPVTGWALDDIEVESVKIFRQQGNHLVYIGDAVMVAGARPDIETAHPGYPKNDIAGWGYMMLTNFLPNGGNGTFTLYAVAADGAGQETTLGSKTITCDNAHAVKPFGAIDTPAQGGTAAGSGFINWGWVLTPQPNAIPVNGSTINVYVDGINLGHPHYNIYRADIAQLFPGYANSNGAVGYFSLDTTAFTNGVHTIQWTATDDAGNHDGIGSRYFSVQNSSSREQASGSKALGNKEEAPMLSDISKLPLDYPGPVMIRKGYDPGIGLETLSRDENGQIIAEINQLERVEIHFSYSISSGHQLVNRRLRPLPIGSSLDRERGIFYWQPGPGHLGNYQLLFIVQDKSGKPIRQHLTIKIRPGS
jgi:hypothetical protein